MAGADCDSDHAEYGNVSFSASIIAGSPKAGYVYRKFEFQDLGSGPLALENDTDGAGLYYNDCHHRNTFAFMAAPESLSAGKLLFIVNEDNTIWKYNLPAGYLLSFTAIGSGDSTSTISGTGSALLDGATTFPATPGSIGCGKMD